MSVTVVVAATGTGGHLSPALAVAGELQGRGARVLFVGTPRGMEGRMVPESGYALRMIDVLPLSRSLGARLPLVPLALVRAVGQARRILREERASAALAMGGAVTLPVAAAARLARVPAVLHEQNSVPGIANRLAAHLVRDVGVAFEDAVSAFPRGTRARVVGMPVAERVASLDREAARPGARDAFGLAPDRPTLLVFGGSQGAATLNRAAVGLAGRWRDRDDRQMLVAAGRAHAPSVAPALERAAGRLLVRCVPFIDRMDLAYAAADLAVCRAGAGTVAELAAAGLPAVLVPYPYARGGHQDGNARALGRLGAAVVVPDAEANAERLGPEVDGLLGSPPALAGMGEAARRFARPRAAADIAGWVLEEARGRRGE